MNRRFWILVASILTSAALHAQTDVFTTPPVNQNPPGAQVTGTPGFEAEWAVSVDVRRLAASKAARSGYSVRLADGSSVRLSVSILNPLPVLLRRWKVKM